MLLAQHTENRLCIAALDPTQHVSRPAASLKFDDRACTLAGRHTSCCNHNIALHSTFSLYPSSVASCLSFAASGGQGQASAREATMRLLGTADRSISPEDSTGQQEQDTGPKA